MKSENKILIVGILLIAVIAVGAYSAGWFVSGNNSNNNVTGEVNIAAAASLKNVFDNELIPLFERKNPGVHVTPTYASSGDLQSQIENGLDTDIFISASNRQMNALANESLIDNSTNVQFLENTVVLIVPANSSSNISSFNDLANMSGNIAIGDPESVPAGQYAKEALVNLGIWKAVEPRLSLGTDVTAVLNQVAQGSAECGIVYATDAASTNDVRVVCEAPEGSLNSSIIYPIAMIKNPHHPDTASAFMEFLQSQEAKDIFIKYGFTIH